MPATATQDALSPPAREFLERAGKLLIGGEWVEAADGLNFATNDPATGETIAEVAQAGEKDVDAAVASSREALEGDWRKLNAAKKSAAIYKLSELIMANRDELAELEALDNGKPLAYAKGDIAAAANHLAYYAGWPTKIEGETIPVSTKDMLVYTRKEPVGVCAQIIPWNFPLLMASWKIAPALAAGCTTNLKPAEQTPLTALRLGELILEAGIPPGVVNILTGDGATGQELVEHPGDRQDRLHRLDRGRARDRRARRPRPEAGHARARRQEPQHHPSRRRPRGRDPGLLPGDLLQRGPGLQRRLAPLRAPGPVRRGRQRALPKRRRQVKLGPGLDPETEMGPLVSEEQLDRVTSYIEAGKSRRRRGGHAAEDNRTATAAATSSSRLSSRASRTG